MSCDWFIDNTVTNPDVWISVLCVLLVVLLAEKREYFVKMAAEKGAKNWNMILNKKINKNQYSVQRVLKTGCVCM